jgi:predicted ATPase
MKITHFHAENVHGYLPIDIEFFPDLTFLTGLNGSGKTSALRLLMALLTPNITEFSSIIFTKASVTVSYNNSDVVISASRSSEGLDISLDNVDKKLSLSNVELELFSDPRRNNEESRSPVYDKVIGHKVFKAIKEITTPMFLGLDRHVPSFIWDEEDMRRRIYLSRRLRIENPSRGDTMETGLLGVNLLIADTMHEIRASQEILDDTLRRKLLASAFEYKPSNITNLSKTPSRLELERYRQRLAHIEQAAEGFRLPVPELKTALTSFFESLSSVVDELEKTTEKKNRKESKTKSGLKKAIEPVNNKNLLEWIFNRPQVDSILEHLQWLDKYGSDRSSLHEPIERFVTLINNFFKQTNKCIKVEGKGELHVFLGGSNEPRPVSSLSSGERQLVIMLAHLSLNKNLTNSGVFIVDEPELSLHLDWQERFVDAVREANPSVQLIMATHSPAIILDRIEHCVSLSGE